MMPPAIAGLRSEELGLVGPCVYFLAAGDAILYVGQSTGLHARVAQHRRVIPFERVFFVRTTEAELGALEREWIRRLNPPYNRTFVVPDQRRPARKYSTFGRDLRRRLRQSETPHHRQNNRQGTTP